MGEERAPDVLSRLRRLRRAGTPPESPLGPPPGSAPVWLKRKLRARARRAVDATPDSPDDSHHISPEVSPDDSHGDPARLVPGANAHGPFLARESQLSQDHAHGDWRLSEVRGVDPRAFALLTGDGALSDLDPTRAVYLDTETSGLSGGAGTYVYMVGLGTFDGERFHLWQGFLRGPEQERALLAEVAQRMGAAEALVSFFGKSFDRHRLEDKMRIAGVRPPFEDRPHLDLYHPFQRLTKGRLPDGRLQTLERELCGLARPDDLPGCLAPAAWFDYLAGRAHRLEGVFRHNADDVLSLVTLAAYLGSTLSEARADGTPLRGCAATRARALARAHLAAGDRRAALPWLERAVERARGAGLDHRQPALERAEVLRKLGERRAARSAFDALLDEPPDRVTVPATIGLAKLLEHGLRDPATALELCRRAIGLLEDQHAGAQRERLAADLERRVARLTRGTEPERSASPR